MHAALLDKGLRRGAAGKVAVRDLSSEETSEIAVGELSSRPRRPIKRSAGKIGTRTPPASRGLLTFLTDITAISTETDSGLSGWEGGA